jgi:two-component system OmpR family response regulator
MKEILIVDDESNVRLNYRLTLQLDGYAVTEAASAAQAVVKLQNHFFDLAILDLRMPGTDGLELLRVMREEGIPTPAIMVTAYGAVPQAVRAMKLGALEFLLKPLRPADLRRLVAEIVGRQREHPHLTHRDDFDAHLATARRLIRLENLDAAHTYLLKTLELNDRSAEAFNLGGVIAEMKGDVKKAHKFYGRSIWLDGHYEPAQQNMRRLYEVDQFGKSEEPVHLGEE